MIHNVKATTYNSENKCSPVGGIVGVFGTSNGSTKGAVKSVTNSIPEN